MRVKTKTLKLLKRSMSSTMNLFPDSNVELLHGRMKSEEKEAIMAENE